MSGNADRIRRILDDHGPALRRASDATTQPAAPTEPATPPAASTTANEILRERLAALRAHAIGTGPSRGPGGAAPEAGWMPALVLPEEDGRTLEAHVGAVLRTGRKGSFLQTERRWSLAERHGHTTLAAALERPIPLRRRERRVGGGDHVHARDAVFLDLETTGLSGGTGTIAFLVGAGRFVDDAFVVRQYFLRDFPDEPALLEALVEDVGDAPLVTFNGRCFDAPLLTTRLRIHRVPFADRDHLDLLPPARRLWAGSLESHALSALERHVLGVVRPDDLPGALMPVAYFAWLREARAAGVAGAFKHNELDIVSLAALCGVVGRLLDDPTARPDAVARDHLDTARLLVDHGDLAKARTCLEAAIESGAEAPSEGLRRMLGTLHRRAGDLPAAERTWTRWIVALESARTFDAHPYEELAKLLEHRKKDLRAAREIVERALARCPATDAHRPHLVHRRARLDRRQA